MKIIIRKWLRHFETVFIYVPLLVIFVIVNNSTWGVVILHLNFGKIIGEESNYFSKIYGMES
ncbi:MAG: hypothetical protein JM58_08405 [Peptococcaceae bacterium BICA1-8]|nr:MAG: hypothetical protein JM58_08405 [Peptococcaceae bacterium BICA1-8]